MKAFKQIIALFAALALCLAQGLCACADDGTDELSDTPDWDGIVAGLMTDYQVEPSFIAAGYRNLITGEEHYFNPDAAFEAASMYKVPLCMYVGEHIASGELDWSPYAYLGEYEAVQDAVLIQSDDRLAASLNTVLGGYNSSHAKTAAYMGIDTDTARDSLYLNNWYTPEQILNCLELLYNESDRFPGVIEDMQQASRDRYFLLYETRFDIAHKYGDYQDRLNSGPHYINDCAICFTDQPIAIVLFTRATYEAESFMTAYCTAMCEYAERTAKRSESAPEPTPVPTPRATSFPSAAAESTETDTAAAEVPILLPVGLIALFLVLGILTARRVSARMKTRSSLLMLAVLVSAAAMLLSVVGLKNGTVFARPGGDPARTAADFFDALEAGDYPRAYAALGDYSDLGLDSEPNSEAGRILADALRGSYSYQLNGPCRVEKLTAQQPVRFVFLNLPSMEEAVAEETQRQLEEIVRSRPVSEVYDDSQRVLSAVTEEAYLTALNRVLEGAETYYSVVDFDLIMNYADGRWQIQTSPGLLSALNGGAGY
ncbi:MAG: hypothetical protein IJV41_00455 [Oscillospiraceae bacterium]|nr:hypothetical protein [Oscillospiraceae bacterium]